jgi:outer membrane biogenesis lipoprotein LolB
MKTLIALAAAAVLAGCGVDVATTAATGASIKKQELEQGQKTMQQAQQKIDAAMQQMQERAANAGAANADK